MRVWYLDVQKLFYPSLNRKLGTFECKTKNEPPYAMDDNDEHLLPKTFKVDLQEEGEEGNLVK